MKKHTNKSNNIDKNKKRKILLGPLIPIGTLAIAAAIIVPSVHACKNKTTVKTLNDIEISGDYKNEYRVEEKLDLSNLVVKAKYSDGSSTVITNYTTEPSVEKQLELTDTSVIITYTEGTITKSKKFDIVVNPHVDSITLSVNKLDFSIDSTDTKELQITANIAYPTNDKVTWSIEGDECIEFPEQSSSGEAITVKAIKMGSATLKASADGKTSGGCTINVGCDNVVIVDGDKTYTDVEGLVDSTGTAKITAKQIDTNETLEEDRTTFNKEVVFGKKTTEIGNYMLNECTAFNNGALAGSTNKPLTIPNSVTKIGGGFLESCSKFNQVLTLSENLKTIGNKFLNKCLEFNNGDTKGESNNPITIPNSVKSIGATFFGVCQSLNQKITLPKNDNFTEIGFGFLSECDLYNQEITIPNSVVTIGQSFMSNCKQFNQTIHMSNSVTIIHNYFLNHCEKFNKPLIIPASLASEDAEGIGPGFLACCYEFNNTIDFSNISDPNNLLIETNLLEDVPTTNTIKFKVKDRTALWTTKIEAAYGDPLPATWTVTTE